jgi:phosphatidylserine/phosphatidylglycerophosphate/cardiolipin synthase-like enzyme
MRHGNRFTLLSDGREYFARMLAAVDGARHYVLAEFYLVESGRITDQFIAAFARAVARGVPVRAVFDAVGSRGLKEADRARLRAGGVDLVLYNEPRWRYFTRAFLRDHRKILIVDGKLGFTGGAGLTDEFSPETKPHSYWADCMVEIAGPVLNDWQALFVRTWGRSVRRALDIELQTATALHPGERGRVAASSGLGRKEIGRAVIKRVRKAHRRVWIATAYFWPAARLRRALRHAARRGINVRLVLTGRYTDHPRIRNVGRLFYARLLASGVVIHEYRPRFLHSKMVLCDDWASVGSSNLDRWGALWNLDANQEVDSPDFARQVEAVFEHTCQDSTVFRMASEVKHPWNVRFWHWWGGVVFAWSTRAVTRLRRSGGRRRSRQG